MNWLARLLEWLLIDLPFHPKHTDWEAVEREIKAAQDRAAGYMDRRTESAVNNQKDSESYTTPRKPVNRTDKLLVQNSPKIVSLAVRNTVQSGKARN